ncbi:MAG: ATP-binding protein [Desulfobacterales bacterium]
MNNYCQFLKDIYFFESLSETDILKIQEVCREESFDAGEVIFLEGSMGDRCFIILEGNVEIWKDYSCKQKDLLAIYSPRQLFGELALIDHFPRSATVVAKTPVRLLSIRREDFSKVISKSAPISFSIMKSVSAMIRERTDTFVAELRQSKARLESAYAQLKKETEEKKMLESQLLQSQKMESIGTLAGGIAHDFNNILFPIMGYAEMTLNGLPPESSARRNMTEILKAADRARDLVGQILTFSRQSRQERKPLRIDPIIRETAKLLRATLPPNIRVREDIAQECPHVTADPSQIHQIIMNLCTNAYHAMEDRGGILTLGLKPICIGEKDRKPCPDMFAGSYLKLTVTDTGCGMSREVMERIFDPYFTTKETGKGTGLGLAIVHGIVKTHEGHISVYSQPGKGTVFEICLPRQDKYPAPPLLVSEGPVPGGRERILLVDDELVIARMLESMLEELGYRVKTRTSSVEALCAFQAGPEKIDLLITDLTMPNMSGMELAREVTQIRKNLPVILCTGFSEMISEEKQNAVGIRKIVMKPVVRRELAKVIREVLSKNAQDLSAGACADQTQNPSPAL